MRPPKQTASINSLPLPEIDSNIVERIAAKADNDTQQTSYRSLDPEASRNFRSTTMPFNEYEDTLLKAAVDKAGYKSIKQFMRDAYIAKALKILEGKPE